MRAAAAEISHASLEDVLLERLKSPAAASAGVKATVSLQPTDGESWSVAFDRGRTSLSYGADDAADLVVSGDEQTLAGIISGTVWGIQAFVDGRLVVRKDLALSLRLAGLFDEDGGDFHDAADVDVDGIGTFYIAAVRVSP